MAQTYRKITIEITAEESAIAEICDDVIGAIEDIRGNYRGDAEIDWTAEG